MGGGEQCGGKDGKLSNAHTSSSSCLFLFPRPRAKIPISERFLHVTPANHVTCRGRSQVSGRRGWKWRKMMETRDERCVLVLDLDVYCGINQSLRASHGGFIDSASLPLRNVTGARRRPRFVPSAMCQD